MKRFLALVIVFLTVAAPVAAQEPVVVTVTDLLNRADEIEGDVAVIGELIGDYGFRNDGTMWTQLNGDGYAYRPVLDGGPLQGGNVGIAVRIPAEIAETLDGPGGYRVRGPLVRIVGEWKYHDPDRGGETYIDVASVEVVEGGHGLAEHPNYWILGFGMALILAAALLRRGPVWRKS